MPSSDTIHALASAVGRAGIAVMRISGPQSGTILEHISRAALPPPRHAALRRLRDADGSVLDRALILWCPAPASFTGEDVAELHLHGGSAVIAAVDRRLRALGARPAEAGEFSRRAFLNGRIELIEAEGIADLIDAETEAQRQQALRQTEGALGAVYGGWRDALRQTLALQEADIDFPDETGGSSIEDQVEDRLDALILEMSRHLSEGGKAERLRNGVVICVSGEPNVGKSSLVNRLVQEDVSIVSDRAGTTRDLVEARLVLAGVPVTLVDTAGLRQPADDIEAEGIRRARARADMADLVLEIVVGEGERAAPPANVIRVVNKIDLQPSTTTPEIGVSARTGAGITTLIEVLTARVREIAAHTPHPAMTRGRHRSCIEAARDHLVAARALEIAELRGEELRLATLAVGRLTGRVDVEDVLDAIFSSFCIGK